MDEIEVPTEHLHETIKEKVEELNEKEPSHFSMYIAISTALMAVLAAISSLMAGHHSNEAMIDQIKASDQWAYYQAKTIKAEIRKLESTTSITSHKTADETLQEGNAIKAKATSFEESSEAHLAKHMLLARAVTLFQVAIAISAISILTKKSILWWGSLIIAIAGLFYFISSIF